MNRHVPIETYGVELHTERAQEAAAQLNHALSSDIFRCSIANRTFNLLWLNPPYDWDREDKRVEHAFLTHCNEILGTGRVAGLHRPPRPGPDLGPIPDDQLPARAGLVVPRA